MSSIIAIQHVPAEGLGRIEPLLRKKNIDPILIPPDDGLDPAALRDASGLIILGGPMSVYEADRFPRLQAEMSLIREALQRRLPFLGLCLGSQLLAAVLGSRVRPGPAKELGWLDVTLEKDAESDPLFKALPHQFKALHWHGDIFDLPRDARHLARSEMTACQAFSCGSNAWGLLFHLEADSRQVQAMAAAFPDEVCEGGTTPAQLADATVHEERNADRLASRLFGAWAELIP